MDIYNIIIAIIIMSIISGILGLLISIVSKIFFVKTDERKETIYKMLPGYNCGACGKAGCMGLAEDICINKNNEIKEIDEQFNALCSASDYKIGEDGLVYISGESNFATITQTQMINSALQNYQLGNTDAYANGYQYTIKQN